MRLFTVFALVIPLVGCSVSPTQFVPMQDWGGYSETQVNRTVYEVRAVVNYNTQAQVARDYALTRSAQLACQNNYPYFEILDQEFTRTTGKRTAEHFNISRLKIKLHEDQKGDYYEASLLYQGMKEKYSLPPYCR